MFLSDDELSELTGYVKQSYQIQWLQKHGISYVMNKNKKPKVLREVVLSRLGISSGEVRKPEPQLRLP